jgi:hypothetical protein
VARPQDGVVAVDREEEVVKDGRPHRQPVDVIEDVDAGVCRTWTKEKSQYLRFKNRQIQS